MKQQIHINDQGELLLIEAPEKPTENLKSEEGMFEWRKHDEALTSAIEKGIKIRDQEAVFRLLFNQTQRSVGFNFWKDHLKKGQSFDLPNSYTADTKWHNPCIEHKKCLRAEEQGCSNCSQINGNVCYKEYRVAVLIPLKQDKCNVCFDEWPETCPKCSKSGEPGNEAKKEDGRWIKTDKMPDYDGDYLCFIVRHNECGTHSKYQRVRNCHFNKWRTNDDLERVTHWQPLGPEPSRTVHID